MATAWNVEVHAKCFVTYRRYQLAAIPGIHHSYTTPMWLIALLIVAGFPSCGSFMIRTPVRSSLISVISRGRVFASTNEDNDKKSRKELEEFDKKLLGTSVESKCRDLLTSFKWPRGLQDVLISSVSQLDKRYFVLDNSGSMCEEDGHHFAGKYEMSSCSRWDELVETMQFQVQLADAAGIPSEFIFINPASGTSSITVGSNEGLFGANKALAMKLLDSTSPGGLTPLCSKIDEVIADIKKNEARLRATGKSAVIIIATDGLPSDGDIIKSLKQALTLPVQLVVRLYTDDASVVKFWNKVDADLELPMDVLDDLSSEAAEVGGVNPWIEYLQPMHQLREAGAMCRDLDLIDERKLSLKQTRSLVSLIFGQSDFPDPEKERVAFLKAVEGANDGAAKHWSPLKKKLTGWIDLDKVK